MTGMRALVAVVAALALAGCSAQIAADETTGGYVSSNGAILVVPPAERQPAPELSGPTLDGDQVATSDFAGQVVVVNVWYSYCPPCRAEADDLAAASRRLADSDVVFLGLNIRDSQEAAEAFQTSFDVPYPSIYDPDGSQLLEFPPEVAPIAVPTTYIFDTEHRVAARILDETTANTLIDIVTDIQESNPGG